MLGKRRLMLAAVAAGALAVTAAPAAAKGPSGGGGGGTTSAGTITISSATSVAGATANFILRYQTKGGFSHQVISFGIPSEFTPPIIGTSGPGNVSVLKGTCSTNNSAPYLVSYLSQQWVQFADVSCPKGGNYVQIGYNNVAVPQVAGKYTFPGYGPASSPAAPATETVNAGPVSYLAFAQNPGDVAAGTALSPVPVVQAIDQYGNSVTGNVALSLRKFPSGTAGTINAGATSVAVNSAGYANFFGIIVNTADVYTLRAALGSLTADSSPFTVNPAAPTQLAFVGAIPDAAAGATLAVQVAVKDTYGNVEINDNATVVSAQIKSPNTAGGTLSGFSSGPTVVNGIATFPNLSIDRQGVYTLTASASPSLSKDSAPFTVNAVVARPQNGAGNWVGSYGNGEWWLFEYGVSPAGDPYSPPGLQVVTNGAGATLGDLTGSGASGWSFSDATADDRALANPCAGDSGCAAALAIPTTADRASGALYSTTSFNTDLHFATGYTGTLTVYAVDWDTAGTRHQTVVVHDALGDQMVDLSDFHGGAYVTFNITTGNNSNVTITATNVGASPNAVIAGLFLN